MNQHLLTGLICSSEEVLLVQLKCLEWDFSKLFCLLDTEGMEVNCKNISKVLEDLGFWCRNWLKCIWLCVWRPENYPDYHCCCCSWFLEMWFLTHYAPDYFQSSDVNCVHPVGLWEMGEVLFAACEDPTCVVLDFDCCRGSVYKR